MGGGKFLDGIGGRYIIIHHLYRVSLSVEKNTGGAHCAQTKEISGMAAVSKHIESFSVCGRFMYLVLYTL
jgi:hypothetical protein